MNTFAILLLALALPSSNIACDCETKDHFNVMDYGAIGDGETDDSQAFLEAWDDACSASTGYPRVIVPTNKIFLVNPIIFNGPCEGPKINFMISGTIIAPHLASLWVGKDASQWLGFKDVNGLNVDGFGTIDGSGKTWWDQSCRYHPELKQCTKLAPTAMKFLSCNASGISNLIFTNSAQTHILVRGCNSFTVNNVVIQSPGNSPNTDGVHIHASRRVTVTNSKIGCGDDCISIGDHISNIQVANVECGPGHGISIGSLGKGGNYVKVQNIRVTNAFFNGTTNGARIKTWQVGRGYLRDVTFENLIFDNVKNPIIIDQNYCAVRNTCEELETGVRITNVVYREMSGTSSSKIAINLNCSRSVPCHGILMDSIKLISSKDGKQVIANCTSAHGQENDVEPGPCLLP